MPEIASTFLPLLAIMVIFWLIIIRPAQRRNKALDRLRAALEPGDRVMTTSGIFGRLTAVDGERVRIEIAPGTEVEMLAAAIASREDAATTAEPGPDTTTDPQDR